MSTSVSTFSPSRLERQQKAGLLRGAKIKLIRNRAFSYDVVRYDGEHLGHRRLYSAAEKLALSYVPLEHFRGQ